MARTPPRRNKKLSELSLDMVRCRLFQHAWEDVTGLVASEDIFPHPSGTKTVQRCTSCMTLRFELWGKFGQLINRQYQYPEGYQLGRDLNLHPEMTARQAARYEWMLRTKQGES